MLRKLAEKKRTAQSTVEYTLMIVLLLGAFLVFQKYIIQGVAGRWRAVGELFGQGRIYQPGATNRCMYDYVYTNLWYDVDCFDENCDCFTVRQDKKTCDDCIKDCADLGTYPHCQ